ncbi:oxygen-independent coproporphyrinogen III oxidase [Trichlorobacter lovleyi]|uniref:oxygen-independent coproporphyrinogen III oxidase n=1 Tax=Trichlorobacter lovleyi TaxID=313985 RepID=UPI0023F0C590|nr:oxygen-independent coproporphyrinogen III oxidase [Trichlorobacter lovleyi]
MSLVLPYRELHKKYNVKGSYYTAYPPSGLWQEKYTGQDYLSALRSVLIETADRPLQLYLHFPYCTAQCYYCQCFQLVSNNKEKLNQMVDALLTEINLLKIFFYQHGIAPHFREVHLGGGSPSCLDEEAFNRLIGGLNDLVQIETLDEFAIEIDPRTVNKDKLKFYNTCGINRISFGIQELDTRVQKAINRVQSMELVEELLEMRSLFKGVNFDLLYGLPLQTRETLSATLQRVSTLSPDRIAFSVLGYRPDVFKHNQMIHESDLPEFIERTMMWEESQKFFVANGYERIGMDHFAKPDDELAIAKHQKKLFRNSMGYSVGRFHDTLSVGPSGMTRLAHYYFQNTYSIQEYVSSVKVGNFPVFRGYILNNDDLLRRHVMNELMTYYVLDMAEVGKDFGIRFKEYFKDELQRLDVFVEEGIVELTEDRLQVTALGNYFLRNICMVFDNLELGYKHNIESGLK